MCLSETYLNSFLPYDNSRLDLFGYKLVRVNNLGNNKMGGVGIYLKETLAVQPVPFNSLKECLLLEILLEIIKDLYYRYIDHQINHRISFRTSCFR